MSRLRKRNSSEQVLVELVEADFETAFSLLDVAQAEALNRNPEFGRRALQEADVILLDIEQRLARLEGSEREPFLALLEELHREIAVARRRDAEG